MRHRSGNSSSRFAGLVVVLLALGSFHACDPIGTPIGGPEAAGTANLDAAAGGAGGNVAAGGDTPLGGESGQGGATDQGGANSAPVCGDGVKEPPEVCDDAGNLSTFFGCSSACDAVLSAMCGDGEVTPPEVCDAPPAYCNQCQQVLGSCGDGIVQSIETCDTKGESKTCNANCTKSVCGDGVLNHSAGEVCDDGKNDGALGGCKTDCSDFVAKASDAKYHSCKDLRAALVQVSGAVPASGVYWLLTNDNTTPYVAFCDMTTSSGGWTLILSAVDDNFGYDDARWSDATLENEQNFNWVSGSRAKYRSYLEVAFDALRTSDVDDFGAGFEVAVTEPNAQLLFGSNAGEGVGVIVGQGPASFSAYFDDRSDGNDRAWGCRDFIGVGLNLRAAFHITPKADSLGTNLAKRCDWDGGARFGQRVNACHFSPQNLDCGGDHQGQGWGNFATKGNSSVLTIRQLLWVR